MIKILVVDDSAFMRKALSMMLESDPGIKVIGTARDGEEGVEKVRRLKPDLVTMDIEMPRMDGLTALREIMLRNPVPVLMISSLTTDGAGATLDALEMGAVDFIPKQLSYVSLDIVKIKDEMLTKIKDIAQRKSAIMAGLMRFGAAGREPAATRPRRPGHEHHVKVDIVTVGASTGGPPALQQIIPRLPANLPAATLVVQHMPATFTTSLAERLNGLSRVTVKEAEDGDPVEPGTVYIAPGGKQMTVWRTARTAHIIVEDGPPDVLYRPCVNVTMNSVARYYGANILAVILTGMGSNGLEGARLVKKQGGVVIAQDEQTSVVFGMPKAVIDAHLADCILPVGEVAAEIASYF
ncbi:MAG: chemotaxis response regulator protein-glutamate methylesterase [candidate division Zixibacteria bacterium]|nr:chemotaxis response regulator protein-glutamate methylesterase [candidate division Zixibacteria bacterium]